MIAVGCGSLRSAEDAIYVNRGMRSRHANRRATAEPGAWNNGKPGAGMPADYYTSGSAAGGWTAGAFSTAAWSSEASGA